MDAQIAQSLANSLLAESLVQNVIGEQADHSVNWKPNPKKPKEMAIYERMVAISKALKDRFPDHCTAPLPGEKGNEKLPYPKKITV